MCAKPMRSSAQNFATDPGARYKLIRQDQLRIGEVQIA
ncbi:hypothetical protein RKLH11_3676 [Rhodobacteraceae bacterium KLH11]|nr:hypothetical protein RKLH11_3676 [Rhodobacteraceae bacterium KLH11]